jgi:hypothetical protein
VDIINNGDLSEILVSNLDSIKEVIKASYGDSNEKEDNNNNIESNSQKSDETSPKDLKSIKRKVREEKNKFFGTKDSPFNSDPALNLNPDLSLYELKFEEKNKELMESRRSSTLTIDPNLDENRNKPIESLTENKAQSTELTATIADPTSQISKKASLTSNSTTTESVNLATKSSESSSAQSQDRDTFEDSVEKDSNLYEKDNNNNYISLVRTEKESDSIENTSPHLLLESQNSNNNNNVNTTITSIDDQFNINQEDKALKSPKSERSRQRKLLTHSHSQNETFKSKPNNQNGKKLAYNTRQVNYKNRSSSPIARIISNSFDNVFGERQNNSNNIEYNDINNLVRIPSLSTIMSESEQRSFVENAATNTPNNISTSNSSSFNQDQEEFSASNLINSTKHHANINGKHSETVV